MVKCDWESFKWKYKKKEREFYESIAAPNYANAVYHQIAQANLTLTTCKKFKIEVAHVTVN